MANDLAFITLMHDLPRATPVIGMQANAMPVRDAVIIPFQFRCEGAKDEWMAHHESLEIVTIFSPERVEETDRAWDPIRGLKVDRFQIILAMALVGML